MVYRKKILIISGVAILVSLASAFKFYRAGNNNLIGKNLVVSGVVVPHHNIVADQRAKLFSELASKIAPPETIILLSPNHYGAGRGKIQTTDRDWDINAGRITADRRVISFLVQNKLAGDEPLSFSDEHGIYNILGDIKKNFPSAAIVPLIFENTSKEQLDKLERGLKQSCAACLMIASVDFSHYQPALLAGLHDDYSIRDLQTLNTADILTEAEVDSGPALALLTMWAADHQTFHFSLRGHTNSGVIAQNTDLESTTHIFGWYEAGDKVEPENSVSFLFGGDMMFARMIYHKFGDDFNDAVSQFGDRVFWGVDAAVVNLEGAITDKPIKDNIQADNLNFQFSPNIVKTLSYLHINSASQANNHSDNAGAEGVKTTRSTLNASHIQTFGGSTIADAAKVAQFKGSGLNLTVIGINLTFPGQEAESIVPLITRLKKDSSMRIIIMPHWGMEYSSGHTPSQAKAAYAWIDAGADLVIGSHPHVVEDAEMYRNVPIIYSLGNLLFDQTFSRATQEGLLIGGKFTEDGLTFFGLPIQSINYQPRLLIGQRKKEILGSLYLPFKDYLTPTPAGTIIQIVR